MSYKIENIQWTIPVTGQSYTDARPVISGGSLEDIIEGAKSVARAVGNDKLYARLSGEEKPLTAQNTGQLEQIENGVLFDKEQHKYYKDGKELLSGSTFAHLFEEELNMTPIAKRTAEKNGKDVDEVLGGWKMKGQVSLDYGSLIHECIEMNIKFGETPSNEYLEAITLDFAEQIKREDYQSEVFVEKNGCCGRIDLLTDKTVEDLKTGDIYKSVKLKPIMKELGFKQERFSLYTLQLNFYARMTGRKKMYIWWLVGEHWKKVEAPYLKDETWEALWSNK